MLTKLALAALDGMVDVPSQLPVTDEQVAFVREFAATVA
jgi:hypothetical protein